MRPDPKHRGVITPADTLSSIPIALEAMAGDLDQLAKDLRRDQVDGQAEIGPHAAFVLGRIFDRIQAQAQAARAIARRTRDALAPPRRDPQ